MTKEISVLLGVFFISILVACGGTQPTPTAPPEIAILPTDTPAPTNTATAVPTATLIPTQTAIATPSSTPTISPTPIPDPSCPDPGTAESFTYPADTTELQASILAYVNAGGQWEDLFALLDELEIKHDWIQADMNGDGVLETAVYAGMKEYPYEQGWWIFHCKSNNYQAVYSTVGSIYGFHDYFEVHDVNNDGKFEIIKFGGYATSACHWIPSIWSWETNKTVGLLPNEINPGCSIHDRMFFQDLDGDDLKEILVVGTTVTHLDFAPPRIITQTFSFEENSYALTDITYAPAEFRFQILDDAQKALNNGNLYQAIAFYEEAAHEDIETRHSHMFLSPDIAKERGEEPDYPDAYQKSFALFRLTILQLIVGNTEEAENALAELTSAFPENEPGYEFILPTKTFFELYKTDKDHINACSQITELIAQNYPMLTRHFYWGGNVAFYPTEEAFCPTFTTPTEDEP